MTRSAGLVLAAALAGLVACASPNEAQSNAPTAAPRRQARSYPTVPDGASEVARRLAALEHQLRDPQTPAAQLPDLAHQQQVIYRVLSLDRPRSQAVLNQLPARWRSVAERHLAARRAFLAMSKRRPTRVPAWRIIPPEPLSQLFAHYRKAEAATGIEWEVLAAVNLVETGMGRIDGVSVANAQGPMQFLPTTWSEQGIGRGDIRNPHDAIQAAARYLVRRGGLKNIRRGLWGYNNSDLYGEAVLLYASLIREDPQALVGLYHWEIHYNAQQGDLWLPVGYEQLQPLPVDRYLQLHPRSAPPKKAG